MISDNERYKRRRPNGVYDKNILCSDCDNNVIGKLDDIAKRILVDRKCVIKDVVHNPIPPYQSGYFYRLQKKSDYESIDKFFISILWRASVSTHKDFSNFSLGSYEELAKQAILGKSSDYNEIFATSLCLLLDVSSPINLVSSNFAEINGVKFFIAIIGYVKAVIKIDDDKMPKALESMIISAQNDILMIEDHLSNMPEHSILVEMVNKVRDNQKVSA